MKTSNWQELQSRVDDRSDNRSYKYVEKIDFVRTNLSRNPIKGWWHIWQMMCARAGCTSQCSPIAVALLPKGMWVTRRSMIYLQHLVTDKNGKCKECGIKLQANDHMKKSSPIAVALLPKGTWVTRRSISNNQDRFSLWVAVVPGWDVEKNLFDFSPLCVFECCLPGRMQIHTGCICLTFIQCAVHIRMLRVAVMPG